MLCKVEKATSRILMRLQRSHFQSNPWAGEITKAQGPIGVETPVHGYESAVKPALAP